MQASSISYKKIQSLPILQLGKTGNDVNYLQSRLNLLGANLRIDGIFGYDTEVAVKKFQRDNDLAVDGIVGTLTWRVLLEITTAPIENPDSDFPILKAGNSGESVVELQTRLNNTGANLRVDGVFGAKTAKAVRDFQARIGLEVDGIVGALTWEAILQQEFLYID
ncbi:peptidoglycan-binding domain-containing protein [Capilliphycus salinus ALCB114379]|uniref:peptidoglycan-binding domain-containing protein n=1 Tax=Capilliphycus salinus TaxID=2768948 RepID=UPI0039A6F136